jgi:hypothetical protein
MKTRSFGTDGWRDHRGYITFENQPRGGDGSVLVTVQAWARGIRRGDGRFQSDRFARAAAEVFAEWIRTLLMDRAYPTLRVLWCVASGVPGRRRPRS